MDPSSTPSVLPVRSLPRAGFSVHLAIALLVAGALLLEVLLTRLLAISVGPNATSLVVALFALGTGFGTLAVFLLPERVRARATWLPSAAALVMAAMVVPAVALPMFLEAAGTGLRLIPLVAVIALPFGLFGIAFAALLHRYPRQ